MSKTQNFEQRKFVVDVDQNPFAGFPRPGLDAAWHELFEGKCFWYGLCIFRFNNADILQLRECAFPRPICSITI